MAKYESRDDLVWLAGLLEGEGSFPIKPNGCPVVDIQMTDRDIIERAAKIMESGMEIKPRDNGPLANKAVFRANVSGNRAVSILEDILPYMGNRRSERIMQSLIKASQRPHGLYGFSQWNRTKVCPLCHNEFTADKPTRIHCSRSCAMTARWRKHGRH